MAKKISDSIAVDASSSAVFAVLSAVKQWPEWDPEVVSVDFSGKFAVGESGMLKPEGAPKTRIKIVEVTPNKSCTVQSSMPLCKLSFVHELSEQDGKTIVVNDVIFDGLLAPLWFKFIGGDIAKGLPKTLQGLKKRVENS